MTIKQLGGVFGRNPTFNNVTIEGTLTFDGDIDINSDLTIEDNLYVLGSVGIGTSSPTRALDVAKAGSTILANFKNTGGATSFITLGNTTATADQIRIGSDGADLTLSTNYAERMRIDSSGNVGIGTSSPALAGGGTGLHINATSYPELKFTNSTTGAGAGDGSLLQSSGNNFSIQNREAGSITFSTSNTLRATLDASGNLLVGKTASNTATVGIELRASNLLNVTSSGAQALQLNRLSSDGDIAKFLKDGTTVGSIGTSIGSTYIGGNGDGAIYFNGSSDIRPWNKSTQANADGVMDLGANNARFKDLHLSGGVVFGTTGGAVTSKTLDDYEEGTWTPAFTFATSGSVTYTTQLGTYRKVGSLVFVSIAITIASVSSPTGAVTINNLPFTSGSDSNFSAMTIGQVRSLVTARPDLAIYQNTSTTKLTFSIQASNAGFLQFQGSDLQAGTVFFISGSYISA